MADVYPESTEDKSDAGGGRTEEENTQENSDQSADSPNRGYLVLNPQNPFASKPALKTDLVSCTSSTHHQQAAVHIAPSKLGTNPFVTRTPKADTDSEGSHKSSILAPSKLGILNKAETASSPSKVFLRPSVLSAQVQSLKQKESEQKEKENQETVDENSSETHKSESCIDNKVTQENYFAAALGGGSNENYFAAAFGNNDKLPDSTTDNADGKEFVFGENLNKRVTGIETEAVKKKDSGGFVFGQNLADRVLQSEGGGDSADEKDHDSSSETELDKSGDKTQTLEESAREFQAKHDKKPELKEVEVKTGEEGESNVLQATGKLFVFETQDKNWLERGRGLLRLNDSRSSNSIQFESRLVMRTQGSLRLILNTKIWPGMTIERASQKSVRITGTDTDETVKVFLFTTSPKDSDNIVRAVDWRIQQLRVHEERQDETKSAEKRKADSPTEESIAKKSRTLDDQAVTCVRREESDSSVVDPETDASSESYTSSFTARSESD